ncbi:MAG: hypothetical protein LBV33_03175 [Lachnospiraceae bacterium]|jgi:hypothetical protein|nr:hypothetical protein [Lachnospiraceae bacterium]
MAEEPRLDYEAYIQKRLNEIENLDERREAKLIIWDGLRQLFKLTESKYADLEARIYQELQIDRGQYAIGTALIKRSDHDPIHERLFPVCEGDIYDLPLSESGMGQPIYFAGSDEELKRFLAQKTVEGTNPVTGDKITFRVEKDDRYMQAVEKLHKIFTFNRIPWHTVHTGFIERFCRIVPELYNGEALDGVIVEWGDFVDNIKVNQLLLWNVEPIIWRISDYMMPGVDGIYYEHSIALDQSGSRDGYLVESSDEVINIRCEDDRIVLKTKAEEMGVYAALRIHKVNTDPDSRAEHRYDGLLINQRKENFSQRFQYQTGNFIQTKAELLRRINEIGWRRGVTTDRFEIVDTVADGVLEPDMNSFISAPAFPFDQRKYLVLYFDKRRYLADHFDEEHFSEERSADYLFEADIRYLLSELQLEYIEYHCVGKIARS